MNILLRDRDCPLMRLITIKHFKLAKVRCAMITCSVPEGRGGEKVHSACMGDMRVSDKNNKSTIYHSSFLQVNKTIYDE